MNLLIPSGRVVVFGVVWLISLSMVLPIQAHMPWLASDAQGRVVLWFGESPDDRTYPMPESVASIALHVTDDKEPLTTKSVDSDELVGLLSEGKVTMDSEVFGTVTYGLYHGMKLTYHVEHLPQQDPKIWPLAARDGAALQTVVRSAPDGGVVVKVLRDGKPAKGVDVQLYCEDGHEEGQAETDSAGMVMFSDSQVEPGLNGLLIGVKDESASGQLDGKPYTSSADYLTATFFYPQQGEDQKARKSEKSMVVPGAQASVVPSGRADLPEELTSFGAAIVGEKLYVYGGHTGAAHSYSIDEQSSRLWCLDLTDKASSWETKTGGPRLQGLALVPWGNQVVRVGGFTAMNQAGQDHDLVSQSSVAIYNPATDSWSNLDSMPEPRSSFDAAVLGDRVYVLGGWQLSGGSDDHRWLQTAYSLSLSDADAKWQPLAKPPFQRRALSVAAHDGRLYAIGGMQSEGGPTVRVDVYNPVKDSWTEGPSLPGSGMAGFGSSAYASDGRLYVTTMDGFVHQLSAAGDSWTTIAKVDPARFFHRMLPTGEGLLLIGGANMQSGKFTEIDLIKPAG